MLNIWFTTINAVLRGKDCFYLSGKKLSRNITVRVLLKHLLTPEEELTLPMLGFAPKKLTMLTDYYYNKESVDVAITQLSHRRERNSYGSVGVTGYNHFAKKERPQHGPCIQSVVITHRPGGKCDVDVFYRTTEVFKKFGADLVWLRTVLLPKFNLTVMGDLTFHFANSTYHPMYWVVSAPYLPDPVAFLKELRKEDLKAWQGILRWTIRFVNQEPSLIKFKQGYRVSKHLHKLMSPDKLKELTAYIRKNRLPKRGEVLDDDDTEV